MKILFVHNTLSSFVEYDLDILKTAHDVREISQEHNNLLEIAEGVAWCDLIFGWWASWHMLLPAIFAKAGRKGVIVVGGDYDVVFDPYGSFEDGRNRPLRDRLRWLLGYILFKFIDRFVTFSEYATTETLKLPYVNSKRVEMVYLGLPDLGRGRLDEKKDIILSVGRVSRHTIQIKGWGTFVKAARLLPQRHFEMIGPWKGDGINLLREWNDNNVVYPGYLSEEDLRKKIDSAKVIVQVSYREGFGLALAEAMLFECVPVVTGKGSLPEVVGDTGLYVPYDDPEKTAEAIEEALRRQKELGPRARDRILNLYPLAKRGKRLLEIVNEIYSQYL